MALHISAEVILANLTIADVNNIGVDFHDINVYCQKIKEKINGLGLNDDELSYIYFQNDNFSIKNAVIKYQGQFSLFKNKIYKRDEPADLDLFNNQYKHIKDILILSADETMKLAQERQGYLGNFSDKELTENDFVHLLLAYIAKRGINSITEEELSKKLFSYYKSKKYSMLFTDICKDRYSDKVNIQNGIYGEKYFSGNIMFISNDKDKLHLLYGANYDMSTIEEGIDPILIKLLNKMADELGVRNKIESSILNVYGDNPNKRYSLVNATNLSEYRHELITDGIAVKNHDYLIESGTLYPDPSGSSCCREYRKGNNRCISIKGSTYVILQGIVDDKLKNASVFTKILNLNKLKQIKELAVNMHDNQESLLIAEKPYVRKLILK